MDWSHYSTNNKSSDNIYEVHYSTSNRSSDKIYEDSYVTSWGLETTTENGQITSEKMKALNLQPEKEKARYIDCKGSNKYNITQTLAETFEVFCQYEYKCDQRGHFIRNYVEQGKQWTGRKVIFYNRAIKTDQPVTIEYKKNLNTISRTKDSSEIYTKLYITPIKSSTMETGYISIADTAINPNLDDFILNFDYLTQIGAISQYQLNYAKTYEVETYKINQQLINILPTIEDLKIQINNLKTTKTFAENEKKSAQEALQEYQTLRDSEVVNTPIIKNKNNSYSIIFIEDGDIKKAALQLYGIDITSIKGYSNYTYNKQIFNYNDIQTVSKIGSVNKNDTNYYIVLDEFGYPTYIYTAKDNSDFLIDNSSIIYLELSYSPKNAYIDICNQLENIVTNKNLVITTLENSIQQKQNELNEKESIRDNFLKQKEFLNQKLETTLGPALREGYWTPESYEDPGEARKAVLKAQLNQDKTGAILTFDTEPFENEETNYYYSSVENIANNVKTYYDYIDLSEIYSDWNEENIENLTIHLLNPTCSYTVGANSIPAGNYFIIYNNGIRYYFELTKDLITNQILNIEVDNNSEPIIIVDNEEIITTKNEIPNATNITNRFEGIGNYLGERLLYNNAGFIFGFLKKDNEVKPILVLNNLDISYNKYQKIIYSFSGQKRQEIPISCKKNDGEIAGTFCYPRIIIYDPNVNYKSDQLKIISYLDQLTQENQPLENYKDYTILTRNGKPHFTLKITNSNSINKILEYKYQIDYRISRANEMLYLDAKTVAYDNAHPKYSYELTVANIPDLIGNYELGQLVYINDFSIGIHTASGYISGIKLKLNNPQDDQIEIKNYKTKFEDLFSTITASSEAIKNNQVAYNIAAKSFNSDGTIEGSILQNSILNNHIAMSYSNTNVEIDDINGIVLTNQQPYLNGVYGQVKLMGGGIFLSNAIDSSGARIWNTGITPNGINAALITTGQLDVNKIRVFAGDNIAFQWNGEGIFAYKQNENKVDLNTYVKYSDKGLQFISNNHTAVDLGWNGLLISTQDGSTELTGKYGLVIYDGEKKVDENNYPINPVVRLGKFQDPLKEDEYGLRLYKYDLDKDKYTETLITSNQGQLWLKDYLIVGSNAADGFDRMDFAGISGVVDEGSYDLIYKYGGDAQDNSQAPILYAGNASTIIENILYGGSTNFSEEIIAAAGRSVRFWAGSYFENRDKAPFRVLQNGSLYATLAYIKGTVYAENGSFNGKITAQEGDIGGWKINKDSLSTDGIILRANSENGKAAIIVGEPGSGGNSVTITSEGTLKAEGAIITGTINATGGVIGGLTIEDFSKINENLKGEIVEITSSKGYITIAGKEFKTIFTATIKRGGIDIPDTEYSNYSFKWKCRDSENDEWKDLPDSENSRFVIYSEIHKTQRYIRCDVTKGE